ncbi:MAG: T9SS type A sorting domain-containing protein, partial [Flavisolibacter sp.]
SKSVDTYYNLTDKAAFTGIVPNAQGQIIVNIKSGTTYNYLNGFVLTAGDASLTSSKNAASNVVLEEKASASLEIFPNPSKDQLVMQLNNNYKGKVTIQIVSQSGSVTKNFVFDKNEQLFKTNLSVSELAAGVYFLRVEMGGKLLSKKMIKF